MRTPLPYFDAFDGGVAAIAGFAGALVDLKIILKVAAAIYPVDAGAFSIDSLSQNVTDAFPEAFGLSEA